MTSPYDGKLPPGWTSKEVPNLNNGWAIQNEIGVVIAYQQIDSLIPLESHVQYLWERYNEENN